MFHGGPLFYYGSLPWRSLLYLWGMIWMPGGHRFSWSVQLLGCLHGWGRISDRSSSFFSETKLETSFSTVSHFIFLALTQSSKVLKWTLLVLYLTSGVLKGIKFSLTFLTMSWEARIFLPRLTHGLERSLSASVFWLNLWSRMCTRGLERSQLLSLLLSTALCTVDWGLEMSFLDCSFHRWLISHLYEGSWNGSWILWLCPLVGPLSTVLSVVKSCSADLWPEMTKLSSCIHTNQISWILSRICWNEGLEMNSFCVLFAHFVLKVLEMGSWNESNLHPFHPLELLLCSDLLLGHLWGTLPSIFVILVRLLGFASVAVTDFAILFAHYLYQT